MKAQMSRFNRVWSRRDFWLTGLAALAYAPQALAHRMPMSSTDINIVSEQNKWRFDFTHRMPTHDALALLGRLNQPQQLETMQDFARLGLYYERAFLLRSQDELLPQSPIGAETVDNYFFYYAEMKLPKNTDLAQSILVKSSVLSELSRDWLHHINITKGNQRGSLNFSGRSPWRPLWRKK